MTSSVIDKAVEDELMLANRRNRKLVAILEALLDIVRRHCRKLAGQTDVLAAEHQDIAACPQNHTEITHKSGNMTY